MKSALRPFWMCFASLLGGLVASGPVWPQSDRSADNAVQLGEWISKAPKITRRGKEFFVIDGDMLLDLAEAEKYAKAQRMRSQPPKEGEAGDELIILYSQVKGIDIWPVHNRAISYSTDWGSFPTLDQAKEAESAVREAASDWVRLCPACGLSFTRLETPSRQDGGPHFVIEYVGEAPFIASSFFPSDPPESRVLSVGSQFYATKFNKVGVMRHEIGHVLGYRHEHTRGVPNCTFEDRDWKPLTKYDPVSVMHYLCGGGATWRSLSRRRISLDTGRFIESHEAAASVRIALLPR